VLVTSFTGLGHLENSLLPSDPGGRATLRKSREQQSRRPRIGRPTFNLSSPAPRPRRVSRPTCLAPTNRNHDAQRVDRIVCSSNFLRAHTTREGHPSPRLSKARCVACSDLPATSSLLPAAEPNVALLCSRDYCSSFDHITTPVDDRAFWPRRFRRRRVRQILKDDPPLFCRTRPEQASERVRPAWSGSCPSSRHSRAGAQRQTSWVAATFSVEVARVGPAGRSLVEPDRGAGPSPEPQTGPARRRPHSRPVHSEAPPHPEPVPPPRALQPEPPFPPQSPSPPEPVDPQRAGSTPRNGPRRTTRRARRPPHG